MVHRHKPVLFFAHSYMGKSVTHKKSKVPGWMRSNFAGQMAAQGAPGCRKPPCFAIGHQEEDIAGLCAQGGAVADGGFSSSVRKFHRRRTRPQRSGG